MISKCTSQDQPTDGTDSAEQWENEGPSLNCFSSKLFSKSFINPFHITLFWGKLIQL